MSASRQQPGQDSVVWLGTQPGAEGGSSPEFDLFDLRRAFSVVKRRKSLIVGLAVLGTGLAVLYVNQLVPRYSASAELVVQPSQQNIANIDAVVQGLNPDYYTNETEAAIIRSRELALAVVDRLRLERDGRFNPLRAEVQPSSLDVAKQLVARWSASALAYLLGAEDDMVAPADAEEEAPHPWTLLAPEERAQAIREYAADVYLAGLSVVPAIESRVINVTYASTDPEFAALAANTTAELYILQQLSTKGEATSRAVEFLSQRVNELRQRVIAGEQEIADFRRNAGLVEADGIDLYQSQPAELNQQLIVARSSLAEAEARWSQVQEMTQNSDDVESIASQLDAPLLGRLREQEAGAIRSFAELTSTLGPDHPRLKLAQSQLNDLRATIRNEVDKIIRNLRNEVQIARIRVSNVQAEVNRLRQLLEAQNNVQVTLEAMAAELDANRQLYETFLERLKETDILEQAGQEADARIISAAIVPGAPYYPNRRMMIAAAFVASVLAGIAPSFLIEFLDSGFRSAVQLEGLTGVPALGYIPLIRRRRQPASAAMKVVLERPNSSYGEAIRSLRTALTLSLVDRPLRTVLVTSSLPGEGKTTTSIAIDGSAAASGLRAVAVDADLRHPNLHAVLGVANERGLSNYLSGNAALEDIIEFDAATGLFYITAGARVTNATDLLSLPRMRDLLDQLAQAYDLIVFDSTPMMAVSDALVIVRHIDKTLYVVRWAKTRRDTVAGALRLLFDAGANIAGCVLNQVDEKRQSQYGFGDSTYYGYRGYRDYYKE